MKKLKDTVFYREAIHELNYPFGSYYLFDSFVIAEVREDVVFTWENHGKKVTEDLSHLYDQKGQDVVLITNRINAYSVIPSDWIKFFKHSYRLKGYAIVSYSKAGYLNALLEKLFINTSFGRFTSLESAIEWAKELSNSKNMAS